MKDTLVHWWQGLAPRERRILQGGLVAVAVIAVWLWLWEPPMTGIRKLQGDLPQLQQQFASMRSMADEATQLRAAAGSATPIAAAERPAAVRRSLERAGLWSTSTGSAVPPPVDSGPVKTLSVGGTVTTVATPAAATTRAAPPDVTVDGERIRVRFADVDYGVWIAWLASAETELSAHAARVTVAANAPNAPVGHVKTEVLLDWTPPAGAPARS